MAASRNRRRSSSGETQSQYTTVQLSGLRYGATLRAPIYEDRSDGRLLLLLASGTTLTESLLARIKRRGISQIRVHRNELQRVTTGLSVDSHSDPNQRGHRAQQATRRAEPEIQRSSNCHWERTRDSFVHKVNTHGMTAYDEASRHKSIDNFAASVAQVETLFDGLAHGEIQDAAAIAAVSSESLVRIADDLDLFVALGSTPATDKYLCKHSLQTAMLAMSIGTILGLKSSDLIELGIGCLVHDLGMLQIRQELVNAQRPLTQIEFLEITKHPILTYERLRDVKDVPNGSRLVAYQMHERLDGSGYPRRRTVNQIHRLSKIAAVADVFVALVSPRPYRPALLPYHAVEQILHGARQGQFDQSVVRALLNTVSLFPIGSYVKMNDGRVGKVIRSNRGEYTSPVVELWRPDATQWPVELIDLSASNDLSVVEAISAPQSSAAAFESMELAVQRS
jgi:HD-GYP domain-containing protein (c-di-GMP phosphodiesterase class II)